MAAEQFGVNTLARAMAIILPVNTIGQTWCPYAVSTLREHYGNYIGPMAFVFAIAMLGAIAIAAMPRHTPLLEPSPLADSRASSATTSAEERK
jgi:hypothetical protein